MSQKQSTTTTDNLSLVLMKRKAINSSGRLGTLYDACKDRLLVERNISVPRQQSKQSGSVKCFVTNGSSDESHNILRTIGIEDDLRLSLLLNLTQRIGIVGILNCPYRIDEHTRLLYYSWVERKEQTSDDVLTDRQLNELINCTTSATHVITGISFGIEVIAILQLSLETTVINEIDRIVQKIARSLSHSTDIISLLTLEENDLLAKNIKITVYSNIPDLTGVNAVSTLLHQIDTIKRNRTHCLPITYFLRPLTLLYPEYTEKGTTVRALPSEVSNHIEQYMLHKRTIITNLKSILHEDVRKLLSRYLDGRLYGAYRQHLQMEKTYYLEIKRLSELVIGFRSGQISISIIKDALIDKEQTILKKDSNELVQNLNDLKSKVHLISDLRNHDINYCNVVERDVDKHDDERTIRTKLIMNDQSVRILCSNDTLNKNNHQRLNKLLSDFLKERQRNLNLHIIYADFSYCSYKLHNMMLLSSNHRTNDRDMQMQKSPSSIIHSQPSVPLLRKAPSPMSSIKEVHHSTEPSPTSEITNILLLGETGVGKSTFINAFANYLTFNSLTHAQSNEPTVLIPVSFIMTTGDNFEEHTVKFGEFDSLNNEDFNSVGQSVTQLCKSYVFDLKESRKKVRIIDTPGFGDTRGLEQDDQNMEHILQYISNLTHLNAICFLLKPNSSRLNIFFRTCLTQLFSFLAPTASKNVIFCFTNARSTFYTPGDTAPLLKTMLASASIKDIPFNKENTFCFDSESFRYLVALQNGIFFSELDKDEYETSWSTSMKQSNRLIGYIHRNLSPHQMKSGWQSIKHAQFEIAHMIRPILEAMRNILRNLILCKMNVPKVSIELRPKATFRPIAICLSCKRHPIQVGDFWIAADSPHDLQNKCHTCSCATTHHTSIDYILSYRAINNASSYQKNEMNAMLHRLYFASAEFSHFLIHDACSTKDDLFMLGLLQMIREENDICQEKESNQMNLQLINELETARHEYEQRLHEVASYQDRKKLPIIYEQMKTVCSYPEIREQMLAINQGQEAIMKQYEVVL